MFRISNVFFQDTKGSGSVFNQLGVLCVFVERLRQQAEEFQRTVQEGLRTARALLEELHVRQAKRRGHGRRMD